MFLFVLLIPLLGLTFVGWHLWMLLPLGCVWKTVIIGLGLACFMTLFLDLNGTLDRLPLVLACVACVAAVHAAQDRDNRAHAARLGLHGVAVHERQVAVGHGNSDV